MPPSLHDDTTPYAILARMVSEQPNNGIPASPEWYPTYAEIGRWHEMGGKKRPKLKMMTCARCGLPVAKYLNYHRPPYHLDCGVAQVEDAIRQMRDKSGPVYDKWVANGGGNGMPKRRVGVILPSIDDTPDQGA